ncbi:MAG: hypothetical protein V4521_02195 [Pseudomonadota bacterium]
MFTENVLMPTSVVKSAAHLSDGGMIHLRSLDDENMVAIFPPKPQFSGLARLFNPLQAGMVCLVAQFVASGVKAPLAAKIARRIMEAHLSQPAVEQWAVVVAENGNVSSLPYDQADLRTGFLSGARLAFALVVDLRLYAERVSAAIAEAPRVIGGDDGE